MPIKPETAVDLVGKYARLTLAIKGCKARIGAELDKCPGIAGHRLETERVEAFRDWDGDLFEAHDALTKRAQEDQETHLADWYAKPGHDDGWGEYKRHVIGDDERDICAHCFAAHLIVRERKAMRRQLASVKAAMTRLGA